LQPACAQPQRPPDPSRGFTRDSNVAMRNGTNGNGKNGNGKKPAANGTASTAANLLKKSFKFPNFR
jgi:hypothetical protein